MMPDSELFKTIVQGGSFAMIVLGFVWLLFKAEPGYRATMENMSKNHQVAIDSLTTTFRESLKAQLASFEVIVANMQTKFQESLETHEKQCRSERKEWMEMVREEGELNRESRHDLASRLTTIYAETFGRFKSVNDDNKPH